MANDYLVQRTLEFSDDAANEALAEYGFADYTQNVAIVENAPDDWDLEQLIKEAYRVSSLDGIRTDKHVIRKLGSSVTVERDTIAEFTGDEQ